MNLAEKACNKSHVANFTDLSGEGCSIPIIIFFHDVNYIPWISLNIAFQFRFVFATAEFGPFFAKFRRLLEQSGC